MKITYVLPKFGYRSNESLVTHKVYENNETPSQGPRLLHQNQRIKTRLQDGKQLKPFVNFESYYTLAGAEL